MDMLVGVLTLQTTKRGGKETLCCGYDLLATARFQLDASDHSLGLDSDLVKWEKFQAPQHAACGSEGTGALD